jgi:TRAP transporter TAXI family solute receptor
MKNKMVPEVLVSAVLLAFLLSFGFVPSIFAAGERMEISAGSLGGTLHIFGSAWAKIINKELKGQLSTTVVSTAGSLENARLLAGNKTDVGFVITPTAIEAYNGQAAFSKEQPAKKLRTILSYEYGGLQFVVREDSKIKTMADLRGKRVMVGAPGSSGAQYNTLALEAHGLTQKDYKREMIAYSAAVRAINDGIGDCFAIFAPAPVGLVMEIAATNKIRILPFEKAAIEIFCRNNPGFIQGFFKPESYKNLVNTEATPSVFSTISILSRDDVNEETVYKITKALWDNIAEFQLCHVTAKDVVLKKALTGAFIPLHKGALKYYKEKGLAVPQDLI